MTPAASILRDEIARLGAIPFHRFMEVALYHPEFGYYRRARDPFGRRGDYFTAEQIQPVFGILIAARIRQLREEMGNPADFAVVELGAGRGGDGRGLLRISATSPWTSPPANWPARFTGVVFTQRVLRRSAGRASPCRRGESSARCGSTGARSASLWVGRPAALRRACAEYVGTIPHGVEEGAWVEINLEALRWMERIAARLERGYVFTIDYGYTARELIRLPARHPHGYRRHAASEDILLGPGRARHHRARPVHGAPGPWRAPRARDRALRDAGADAHGRRRAR